MGGRMTPPGPVGQALPDEELVGVLGGGEAGAFAEIVPRTRGPAYLLARRITRNHEDADDVVQESYVKAFRALGRFEAGRALRPRVFTIVARSPLSHVRKKARRGAGPDR